mmetsp:Transcript_29118/g.21666  ORF Transcript_29118/g.21666 Transcript_29118/m.21666 type:complete len:81 (-) Transcript_29118:40-282(-)
MYKDLTLVSQDLKRLVMIDDSKVTFDKFQCNTFRIKAWSKALRNDHKLRDAWNLIEHLLEAENVQQALPTFIDVFDLYQM